jgi:hypothetical protein
MAKIIEWDRDGYPTEKSLRRLRRVIGLNNTKAEIKEAIEAFYDALKENLYNDAYGPDRVEVRGEEMVVWAYHTLGWSGNEDIIRVLQESWIFDWALERYDSGGHYYFKPIEKVLKN